MRITRQGYMGRSHENVGFMARIVEQPNGCWHYRGSHVGDGYVRIRFRGKPTAGHVVAWTLLRGPVPDGLELDHLCRNRRCVNPAHLEPVTHRENVLRSPIANAAINARKSECIRGHAFTPENTIIQCGGKRACRTCVNEAQRRNRLKRLGRWDEQAVAS